MERVSCWRWTISAYVCIAACVLEFDGVTGVQLMQYEVVISPSYAVEIHYNNADDGSVLIDDP